MMEAKLTAIGTYTPKQVVDNKYFEGIIETSDEWIRITHRHQERRMAHVNEFTSDL
jgi:3-oxoacyl-[acyl-carrier-protein] synthase-3